MANRVLCSVRRFSVIYSQQIGKCLQNVQCESHRLSGLKAIPPISSIGIRHSSFRSSEPAGNIENHPEVEVHRNPPEWAFVEKILPPVTVPQPKPKAEYPSGWRPPTTVALPYFVPRTKNHMVPVYLSITYRGTRRVTKLRKIQGDIWTLEKELHEMIEQRIGKKILTQINEMNGQIWFRGDFVTLIQDYLMKKGL